MATIEISEYGGDFFTNPYPYYAKLREAGPVHEIRLPDGRGRAWLVVGHEAARAALTDPRFAKTQPRADPEAQLMGPHVLNTDPPDHTRLRKLVSREFTPRRVEALRPRVQQITDELLDAMLPAGHGDLVDSLAFPLPVTVICELLGVPHGDRETFRSCSNQMVAPTSREELHAAALQMRAYLDALIEDKRKEPGPPDEDEDLLGALLRTHAEDGDRLSEPEVRAMAFILLIAGHETTANLISNGVRALLSHPDQLAALRADPGLLDGAVEETLRFDGPVENATYRFTREPVAYGDVEIPQGEIVLVGLASADRDPARFPSPDAFDIRRSASGGQSHLAFGHGLHFCLGAPLARLEGRIAIGTLLDRCPGLALDEPADGFDWLPGLLIRGVRHLPVRW
jgi:cytochrome P450